MVADQLLKLLQELQALNYEFTAITPATHARVIARKPADRVTLRDIFGWNRRFADSNLDRDLLSVLQSADAIECIDAQLRSKVRVASLEGSLFLHSSYPTEASDSVFFGPDTHRFARFIKQQLPLLPRPNWIVEMGAGSGAVGILTAQLGRSSRVTLVDVNDAALELARINALFANVNVETVLSATIPLGPDVIMANPPYLMDTDKRAYRDGGAMLGGAVALDWAEQAIAALMPGGAMLLYTGVAYEEGHSPLIEALKRLCSKTGSSLQTEEIDPDVFGEELSNFAYSRVERIAAIGAVITKQ